MNFTLDGRVDLSQEDPITLRAMVTPLFIVPGRHQHDALDELVRRALSTEAAHRPLTPEPKSWPEQVTEFNDQVSGYRPGGPVPEQRK